MNRAYSLLTVKAVDEDAREIVGIATTPTADRAGDIVEPKGAEFKLPIPLLWQHDSRKPIGHVTHAKITDDGIEVRAKLLKIDEPGALKDRLDEAWQSIKHMLVQGLSIGFQPVESARIEGSYSYRFMKWLWLELSAVTIPANGEATITQIKSIDTAIRAASGRADRPVVRLDPPGASGKPTKTKSIPAPKEGTDMKTLSERIADFEAELQAKKAKLGDIQQKALDEGRTKTAEEKEEFEGVKGEINSLEDELKDLRELEALQASKAKPVEHIKTVGDGSNARAPGILRVKEKLEPGIRFARFAKCIAISHKQHVDVERVAGAMYGQRDPELVELVKAAVSAMTTGNTSALIGNEGGFADFVEFLRPMTIIGRFGTGDFPQLTQVPFRIPLISETSEPDAQWVGEGKGKGVTKYGMSRDELTPLKVATITVQTMELIRDSSPSSDVLLRNALAKAVAKRIDITFVDPTNAGSAGVRPASVLNGVAATPADGGSDADAVRADLTALMGAFVDANNALTTGVWLMSAGTALKLSQMRNALGQKEFPDISMRGGFLEDIPVMASNYLTDYVALVNAEDIYQADEGGVDIAMSTEASLEMVDNPTQDSGAADPVETTVVSMFQTNSAAFRAERTMNWKRRRASAVAWMDNVTWGTSAS